MFKRAASEALGLSDIGKVIPREDFDKVEADDYVMHEEEERIYFLIKSKADEYCFTNTALIHVDGTSAMSKKRTLRRLAYASHPVSNVFLETAGNMDLDVEIKFQMGQAGYSIDVDKRQLEKVKDLYKTLVKISTLQVQNAYRMEFAKQSLQTAANSIARGGDSQSSESQFKAVNEYAYDWLAKSHSQFARKDFGDVFQKFINN